MIAVFRFNRVMWHLLGRWLIKTRTYTLVNLLAQERCHIVPEYIPWYGSNRPVADHLIDFLKHPEKMAKQQSDLAQMIQSLDRPGASLKVAQLAMDMMQSAPDAAPSESGLPCSCRVWGDRA
jgi:lipid-A-disaccharide synthase